MRVVVLDTVQQLAQAPVGVRLRADHDLHVPAYAFRCETTIDVSCMVTALLRTALRQVSYPKEERDDTVRQSLCQTLPSA